jgi:hypothetical protein
MHAVAGASLKRGLDFSPHAFEFCRAPRRRTSAAASISQTRRIRRAPRWACPPQLSSSATPRAQTGPHLAKAEAGGAYLRSRPCSLRPPPRIPQPQKCCAACAACAPTDGGPPLPRTPPQKLTITPELDSPGLLLDLASVIHGMVGRGGARRGGHLGQGLGLGPVGARNRVAGLLHCVRCFGAPRAGAQVYRCCTGHIKPPWPPARPHLYPMNSVPSPPYPPTPAPAPPPPSPKGISIVEGVVRSSGPISSGASSHLKEDPILSVQEPPEGKRTMRFMLQTAQVGRAPAPAPGRAPGRARAAGRGPSGACCARREWSRVRLWGAADGPRRRRAAGWWWWAPHLLIYWHPAAARVWGPTACWAGRPVARPAPLHLSESPPLSLPSRHAPRCLRVQSGRQLDFATASGLCYALQLVLGRSTPTQLPSINV